MAELDQRTNVWDLHAAGCWVVVPTNRRTRRDGTAVMGAGLARAAAERYPDLPARYGAALGHGDDRLAVLDHRLLLVPTKDDWRRPSTLELVDDAALAVARWCDRNPDATVAVPALGVGHGGLRWSDVRPILHRRLAGRAVVLVPPQEPTP